MSTMSPGAAAPAPASTGSDLRSAWGWGLVAAVLIVAGMSLGPGEGGSLLLLMVVLVAQVAGLFILAWAFRFTVRVLQAGRLVGILPLLLDALLLFWGAVGILGTFGRYFGWDA